MFSIDAHDDRIWALDLSDGMLVSGGADSTLRAFRDTTQELDEQRRQEEEQNILMEQKLANHLRFKEYEHALELALTMDKPRQALKVLTAISDNDLNKEKDAIATLQSHIKNWSMSRVSQVMRYCRDWNTRARNSFITMMTVKAIVTTIPADQLACVEGLPEIVAGIMPYAERHFDRINKLRTSSYLIDFTLLSMGCLDDKESGEYLKWEADSKLLTTPKTVDGRIQVGGQAITGFNNNSYSDAEIISVGESDSENENEGSSESEFE
jgi:U3 small nucleolar RNA-associated protein 13